MSTPVDLHEGVAKAGEGMLSVHKNAEAEGTMRSALRKTGSSDFDSQNPDAPATRTLTLVLGRVLLRFDYLNSISSSAECKDGCRRKEDRFFPTDWKQTP